MSPSRNISDHPPTSPLVSSEPNLTTCLQYQTDHGVFYLAWSRTFLGGHSLHLSLHSQDYYSSPLSFHLNVNAFVFWRKRGSKSVSPKIKILWDLTRAKFESGSEPRSGFYIAVLVDGEMALLLGDLAKEAYARLKLPKPPRNLQALVLRKEHVFGASMFSTTATFGGKKREVSIDCCVDEEDARLCFNVDSRQVLEIKRLRWKFRGSERVEIDGVSVQISWDVYNWLFHGKSSGHAVFMFRFESDPEAEVRNGNDVVLWKPKQCGSGLGIKGGMVEWRNMMRRRFVVKSKRSSSSSSMVSMSSASSACSSSVLEWASSADESEYGGVGSSGHGIGFSLLVYAWIK